MIRITAFNAHPRYRFPRRETLRLVRCVFKSERCGDAVCTVVFIDDKQMINLNGRFLHHWYSTDVLSFPVEEIGKRSVEGEIYVNLDQARRQAREYDVSIRNEVGRLVIHGILHLLGYDDKRKDERLKMTMRENVYLDRLSW